METLEVDMFAEARNAQLSAQDILGSGALKLIAPAKVNLFLGIGARREDGYHEVLTVFHALVLHDTLHVRRTPGIPDLPGELTARAQVSLPANAALIGPAQNLLVTVDVIDKTGAVVRALDIPASENLVTRALDGLARRVGYNADERIAIHIEKNIPTQAGLGGGSSDAAAALLAAARLWGVAPDGPTLCEVAANLGADVAFFLEGGCALMEGAGERLKDRLTPAKVPIVLVKPPEGVPTAQCYARFDECPATPPAELVARTENATRAEDVPLFNSLASAAAQVAPAVAQVHDWLTLQVDPSKVLLSGSGSCLFAIADDFAQASRIASAACAQGWWSRATTMGNVKAAIV